MSSSVVKQLQDALSVARNNVTRIEDAMVVAKDKGTPTAYDQIQLLMEDWLDAQGEVDELAALFAEFLG